MDGNSISSAPGSVSGSSARSTPVPHSYKPITPSASLMALTKTPDEEMRKKHPDELVNIIRRLESENRNIVAEHSNIMKDVNKKMQILLLEVKGLKEINQTLQDDNQELRDLCCFLDDDRQRGRKLAREWQRFGRYTSSVMRSEVSAYQEKLKELEAKQKELISDNLELKELCLYLDQERLRASQQRDEGDGSSSSTVAGNEDQQADIELVPISQLQPTDTETAANDYIRQLENKVRHLEKEKQNITQQLNRSTPDMRLKETPQVQVTGTQRQGPDGTQSLDNKGTSPHKPEAVVHAMKVLEVHENLERAQADVGEDSELDDKEKAIVREMCNVVWRKLGNVKAEQDMERAAQSPPVYENLQSSHVKNMPPESTLNFSKASPSTSDNLYPPGYQHYQQKNDTSYDARRMNNSFGGASNYIDAGLRGPDEQQGSYQGSHDNQSQRPPPSSFPKSSGPTSNPNYGNQQPKYGYIHTSRSTPVTPTPQQQSQPPNAATHRMEPRSHSPGPVRRAMTPKGTEYHSSQSVGHQNRGQYPRTDSQSHVYQNHPSSNSRGDNSYENVPAGYYYASSPSSRPGAIHPRTHDSVSSSNDYHASSTHLNPSQDNYGPTAYRIPGGANASQPVETRSQSRGPGGVPITPQYMQNMPARNPSPTKSLTSMPPSPGFPPQSRPSASVPHFTSGRPNPNQPSVSQGPMYSSQPQTHRGPGSTQPPGYNAPPGYHDRRTSYADPREGNQGFMDRPDRRDPRDPYYKQ